MEGAAVCINLRLLVGHDATIVGPLVIPQVVSARCHWWDPGSPCELQAVALCVAHMMVFNALMFRNIKCTVYYTAFMNGACELLIGAGVSPALISR